MKEEVQIVWTKHAEERQQQWEERLGITREEVEETVKIPNRLPWRKILGSLRLDEGAVF